MTRAELAVRCAIESDGFAQYQRDGLIEDHLVAG
jgi:hypothetical protein